ncbi:MAG TPA: amidohydrolase family protein [Thermoanaerobaculia bacterium]|nr:amidohydrolase family protein [Thermoanaerobaculia bacterium]
MRSLLLAIALLLPSSFSASATTAEPASQCSPDSFAVTDVRVFDGRRVIEGADVIVLAGVIAAVGADVEVPEGLPVIDGTASTLLPGFIDAHAHAWSRQDLERAAQFGVTTELDMWTSRQFARSMRREEERNGGPGRADHRSAISPATPEEGFPYNFTPEIERPTLDTPEEADAFVEARLRDGSDHLKIFYEDGSLVALDLPVLSRETIRALTDATRVRGVLAVAHATVQVYAHQAVEDGVDGLVHVFVDSLVEPSFLRLARQKGVFVVATLSAIEAFVSTDGGASLVADPELAPYLTDLEISYLLTPAPPNLVTEENLALSRANVARFAAAGVPILAGGDTATHGVTLHRELELLTMAGLTPVEALRAATAAPAAAFGLSDRGRIAPGRRADLLLVEGDPTADIKATRALRRIWKAGVEIPRQPATN